MIKPKSPLKTTRSTPTQFIRLPIDPQLEELINWKKEALPLLDTLDIIRTILSEKVVEFRKEDKIQNWRKLQGTKKNKNKIPPETTLELDN